MRRPAASILLNSGAKVKASHVYLGIEDKLPAHFLLLLLQLP
jgi:hypothetical protein